MTSAPFNPIDWYEGYLVGYLPALFFLPPAPLLGAYRIAPMPVTRWLFVPGW